MKTLLLLLASLLMAPAYAATAPSPGPAGAAGIASLNAAITNYSVAWGVADLGDGSLQLTPTGKDCYTYQMTTHPIGVVRWMYGSPREQSQFCVVDGRVQVSAMSFTNPKRPKDGFALHFDFVKGLVTGGRNGPLAIKPGTLDRLSVQQAARLWVKQRVGQPKPGVLQVEVADHKRIKTFTFAIKGSGSIDTPKGRYEAVQFERIDAPNTTLRFWLAPDLDYMPVKVEHVEDGETKLRMLLK